MLLRLLSLYFVLVVTPSVAGDGAATKRGEVLLAKNCSRCHAIASTGQSQHPQAPPFRTLGKRYPVEFLQEALGEGIISGHPDMPEFEFAPADVGAIVAYLKSIQER